VKAVITACKLSTEKLSERSGFDTLRSNISMHFLLTVLHKFLSELIGRICIKSRHIIFDDHFRYSHDLYVWSSSDIVRRNLKCLSLLGLNLVKGLKILSENLSEPLDNMQTEKRTLLKTFCRELNYRNSYWNLTNWAPTLHLVILFLNYMKLASNNLRQTYSENRLV